MPRTSTQFAIALVLSVALGVSAVAAVVAEVFFGGHSELTMVLVVGLVAATTQAVAYLFRINGQASNQ